MSHRYRCAFDYCRTRNKRGHSFHRRRKLLWILATLGVATDDASLPEPIEIDPGHVADVCAARGIEVLGPPAAPLD